MAHFDVIVIGGGINGTGVARDCALRGLSVALFEKNDIGFGASGHNSGMIHGGPRYLTKYPEVTRQSCVDSGYIRTIAKHLVFRIPFIFPVHGRTLKSKTVLAAIDGFFSLYDRYQPLKGGRPHTLLEPNELNTVFPGLKGDFAGAITFDEWGIDGGRVCVLNARDAEHHGAKIYNHYGVESLRVEKIEGAMRVAGVRARHARSGNLIDASGRIIINATGAWTDITRGLIPVDALTKAPKTLVRPGKGIHVIYDRRVSHYGLVTNAIDGRQIFLMPWQNISWIATTDDDYYGDLDRPYATSDEVRYLVEGIADIFPTIKAARRIGTTAAARPTMYAYGLLEDKLSREHDIVDHQARDGVGSLYSMIGGKLASYRIFAEHMSDVAAKALGNALACATHKKPLPGSEAEVDVQALASATNIPDVVLERLTYRHGARASEILRCATRPREASRVVCSCEPVLECEVRHACRHEYAETLGDVARRTRLGLGSCGGMRCAAFAAGIVAEEKGYGARETQDMLESFLLERFQSRLSVVSGAQLAEEELARARYSFGGLFGK